VGGFIGGPELAIGLLAADDLRTKAPNSNQSRFGKLSWFMNRVAGCVDVYINNAFLVRALGTSWNRNMWHVLPVRHCLRPLVVLGFPKCLMCGQLAGLRPSL